MNKRLFLLIVFAVFSLSAFSREECTCAVIGGKATVDNAPVLWKNRDTDNRLNEVVFVNEKPYSYMAIVNKGGSGRKVWCGLNEKGFAIINSVAYNLPLNCNELRDLEGFIMAEALRKCETVEQFESFLKAELGKDLGAQANFGVIDAYGNGAVFEVHNHGYRRLDVKDFGENYLVMTNFSRSGKKGKGFGYLRFDKVSELFKARKKLSHSFLIVSVIRNIDNSLMPVIPMEKWRLLDNKKPFFINTYDSINRGSTASAMVVHGVNRSEKAEYSEMWVVLGEPITSLAVPLWVCTKEVPSELKADGERSIVRVANLLKERLRPYKKGRMYEYLDLTVLDNRQNTGWIRLLREKQSEILFKTKEFLKTNPDCKALREFQKAVASEAYEFLKKINGRLK